MTQTIATANTINGFAIGIIRQAKATGYAVVRMNNEHRYIVLGHRATEADARTLANIEWKRDMGR